MDSAELDLDWLGLGHLANIGVIDLDHNTPILAEAARAAHPSPNLILPTAEERGVVLKVVTGDGWLLAIDAKMFLRPSRAALTLQMARQRVLVDYRAHRLEVPAAGVRRVPLLPDQLHCDRPGLDLPVVTWQQVLEEYGAVAPAYWLTMLGVALDRYERLSSPEPDFRSNADEMVTGADILTDAASPEPLGRLGRTRRRRRRGCAAQGTSRPPTGATGSMRYATIPCPARPNWMSVAQFLAAVTGL